MPGTQTPKSSGPGESITHLLGVSLPRSGHHYLARLLQAALGERLHYCEFYTPLDCCRRVPCCRPGRPRLVYQKSHDFDLRLDPGIPGALYVIQTRAPIPEALSDRELLEAAQPELRGDRDDLLVWLGRKAAFTIRFREKWLVPGAVNRVHVPYERLVAEPAAVLQELCARAGVAVAPAAIAAAVAREAAQGEGAGGSFKLRASVPPPAWAGPFEEFAQCVAGRKWPSGNPAADAIRHACVATQAALDGEDAAAALGWDIFCRQVPDNPHGHVARAYACSAVGRTEDAIRSAKHAAEFKPTRLAALRCARNLLAAQGRPEEARPFSEALVALAPDQPVSLISLAQDAQACGDMPAAVDAARRFVALARAVPLAADVSPKVWPLRSHARGYHVPDFWQCVSKVLQAGGERVLAAEAAEIARDMAGGA